MERLATDGLVLTNRGDSSGVDMLGTLFTSTDSVNTTVHTLVLTFTKTATASVGAEEAITNRLTYANTGSRSANSVVVVDKLPTGVYYSNALNLGAGPSPTTAVLGLDGRWTLTWNLGTVAGSSRPQVIEFTPRPGLSFTDGQTLVNEARLRFTNGNGCTYAPVTASPSTLITVVPPTKNPVGLGYWRNHREDLTAEILARIQATDQRFDGADGSASNGALSNAEMAAAPLPGGNMDKVLTEQLVRTYANLATRRISANTLIDSKLARRLGPANVAAEVVYAQRTLLLSVTSANRGRYGDATTALDQINNNSSPLY